MIEGPPSLAARRASLIALAAAQRQRLAADVEPWRRPLSIADRGIALARFMGSHRAWIMVSAAAPALLRASGRGRWFWRGVAAWRIVRGLRGRGQGAASH